MRFSVWIRQRLNHVGYIEKIKKSENRMTAIVRKSLDSRIERARMLTRMIAYFRLRNPEKAVELGKELAINERIIYHFHVKK